MPTRLLVCAVLTLASFAVLAPAAAADDARVLIAWSSEDRRLERTGNALLRGLETWERSDFRRGDAALKALRRFDRLTRRVRTRVKRSRASSPTGRSARRAVLRSLTHTLRANRALRGVIRAAGQRRSRALRLHARRFERASAAAERETARAVALFEQIFGEDGSGTAPPSDGSAPSDGTQPPPSDGSAPPPSQSPPSGEPPSSEKPPPPDEEPSDPQPGPSLPSLPPLPVR